MNIPDEALLQTAKAIAEKQGFRYAGLSLADKKFYHELAQAAIEAYLVEATPKTIGEIFREWLRIQPFDPKDGLSDLYNRFKESEKK